MENIIGIIGDIHGCIYTLKTLFKNISKDCEKIYSVGDIVDRGNFSRDVIEFFIENKISAVRGNHEDMLLNAVETPAREIYIGYISFLDLYFNNGGEMTEKSYVNSTLKKDFYKFIDIFKELKHYDFIKSFPLTYEFDKVIISHAGIIKGGNQMSMLWNREIPSKLNKLQVFGHTPLSRIKYKKNHYANIDTGCVYGNLLSAIIVNSKSGEVLKTYSVDTDDKDI